MKSLFKRLQKRKGFTLVECIIAIAVFAAFCLMITLIVAGAQRESIIANDTETELNGLVENVMNDDINRGFNSTYSTDALNFNFSSEAGGSGTFSITYDIVDGHKNYVLCTGCGYFANNTEFMGGTACQNFEPWNTNYVCPECGKTLMGSDVTLTCAECATNTNYYTVCDKEYNSSKAWTYQTSSGSFICNHCGSANVTSQNIDEKKLEKSYVSVSGLAPNAIRYGTAIPPRKAAVVSVTDSTGAKNDDAKARISVNYNGTATNPNSIGEFTVGISNVSVPSGDKTKVTITMPAGYYFENLKADNSTDLAAKGVSYTQSEYLSEDNSSLTWEGSSSGTTLTFKLRSYKTGFSFDYDYQNASYTYKDEHDKDVTVTGSGLANYWFGLTGNGGAEYWPQ